MMVLYRVMLQGEDGTYCQANELHSEQAAMSYISSNKKCFEYPQYLYIEEYKNEY